MLYFILGVVLAALVTMCLHKYVLKVLIRVSPKLFIKYYQEYAKIYSNYYLTKVIKIMRGWEDEK